MKIVVDYVPNRASECPFSKREMDTRECRWFYSCELGGVCELHKLVPCKHLVEFREMVQKCL